MRPHFIQERAQAFLKVCRSADLDAIAAMIVDEVNPAGYGLLRAAALRSLFQYGDLHFGHTFGKRSRFRLNHSWWQRRHLSLKSVIHYIQYIPIGTYPNSPF